MKVNRIEKNVHEVRSISEGRGWNWSKEHWVNTWMEKNWSTCFSSWRLSEQEITHRMPAKIMIYFCVSSKKLWQKVTVDQNVLKLKNLTWMLVKGTWELEVSELMLWWVLRLCPPSGPFCPEWGRWGWWANPPAAPRDLLAPWVSCPPGNPQPDHRAFSLINQKTDKCQTKFLK